jgi:metal-responsive CopG/Arc/MetJ family transcriptional regulator
MAFSSRLELNIESHVSAELDQLAEQHGTTRSSLVRAMLRLALREIDGDATECLIEDAELRETQRVVEVRKEPR